MPHERYRKLGRNNDQHREAYRVLFKHHLDEDVLNELRTTLQTGTPLGNARFTQHIEQALTRKVGYARQGRPRNRQQKGCPLLMDQIVISYQKNAQRRQGRGRGSQT